MLKSIFYKLKLQKLKFHRTIQNKMGKVAPAYELDESEKGEKKRMLISPLARLISLCHK